MSANRHEITDDGAQIRIKSPGGSLSTIIGTPRSTHIEDVVIGAIRQQARDIAELEVFAEIGRQWNTDSSLAKWFPLTAERVERDAQEIAKLRTDLAAAVAERDELRDKMACLKEFHMEGGSVDMRWSGESANALMRMLAQMMLDVPNYLESTLTISGHGESYVMTIRKHDGKTPHAMRAEVEAERDTLRARLAALAELDKPAAEPIGFQSRRKGASDWDGVITHRPPDSYELRECEIRNVYTTPPPAKPALGMFTAEEIEAAYTEGLQESPEITREMWLDSCAYKLIQERTK